MKPNEYFPDNYLVDLELFVGNTIFGNGPKYEVCGWNLGEKLLPEYQKNFIGVEDFIIVLYELNLINQGIYTHFHIDFYEWCTVSLPFPDCHGCWHGGMSTPGDILRFVNELLPTYCTVPVPPVNIKLKKLKEYTWFFFKGYVGQLCETTKFMAITPEKLIEILKNDDDCIEFREFVEI